MSLRAAAVLAAFASLLAAAPAQAAGDAPDAIPSDFVRFVEAGDGGRLETAITRYRKDDVEVTFFAAVHIADAACYAALNDRFTTCDALLYELVAAPDARPAKGQRERGFSPVSLLQRGMKTSLELAFQLDEIDYQAANFVHADMTPQEFEQSMSERGESMLSMMFDMMQQTARQQRAQADERDGDGDGAAAAAKPFDLVAAFRSGEGRHLLRMTFGRQLEQVEGMMAGGKGSTLLEGRNEKCLEVLQRELQAGKKRLGVYYGAAHFPHMERRLVEDLGFAKAGHEWLVAWDCKKRPDPKLDRELIRRRQLAKAQLADLIDAAKSVRIARGAEPVPTAAELVAWRDDGGAPIYIGPMQDPWGQDYVVRKRPQGTRWEAASAGQDGTMGTDDDLVVIEPRAGGLPTGR
ncbi:MAG: type II secretion system protein GspG [Planctomycetota bacterium]